MGDRYYIIDVIDEEPAVPLGNYGERIVKSTIIVKHNGRESVEHYATTRKEWERIIKQGYFSE